MIAQIAVDAKQPGWFVVGQSRIENTSCLSVPTVALPASVS